jgi:ABC-type uncharacterized transport system permease subunit
MVVPIKLAIKILMGEFKATSAWLLAVLMACLLLWAVALETRQGLWFESVGDDKCTA